MILRKIFSILELNYDDSVGQTIMELWQFYGGQILNKFIPFLSHFYSILSILYVLNTKGNKIKVG